MNNTILNYQSAKDYLEKNPRIKILLESVVNEIISNKNYKITKQQIQDEYKLLLENEILITNDQIKFYYISFKSSLACAVLLEYAEKYLNKTFPQTPYDAIVFAEDFLLEIRKPKINKQWYTLEFRRNFIKFILLEFENYFLNNFEEILKIFNEEHKIDSPEFKLRKDIDKAIPIYKFTSKQFITLANDLYKKEKFKDKSHAIIRAVSLQSNEIVNELFEIVSAQEDNSPFLSSIIIGLSHFEFTKAFEESVKLLKSNSTEILGIKCICRLNFDNKNQLTQAFQVINNHKSENIQYQKELAFAYKNFVSNEYSTDELKVNGINNIGRLLAHKNKEIVDQAIFWLTTIKGFENEKMNYLYFLLNREIQVDFWNYFKEFSSPSYLFDFVKEIYVHLGLNANMHPFKEAFDTFYRENSNEFESGLAELLSNDYGIIRKAGIDLLISKYYGTYSVNLLNLSEKRQLIVIDTLLDIPLQIEKTLPIVLQLRNSKYKHVKEALIAKCVQLVFAYEKIIITILNSHLKIDIDADLILLKKVKKVWEDYEKIIYLKRDLVELNPFINQRELVNTYYRSEREYQTEHMEHAQKNSSMMSLGLARQISILRGCGFKMEGGDQRISKLGKVETEMYMDKRYFINPAAYEFAYQNHVLNKNYINEEE